jgi:hypothetical protein
MPCSAHSVLHLPPSSSPRQREREPLEARREERPAAPARAAPPPAPRREELEEMEVEDEDLREDVIREAVEFLTHPQVGLKRGGG